MAIDEQMLSDAREAMSGCRPLAPSASSGSSSCERGQRPAARLAASSATTSRAALAAACDPLAPAQTLANWVSGDLVGRLGDDEDPADSRVERAALAALVGLVAAKQISVAAGRQVLDKLLAEGGDPAAIVEAEGLAAIGGEDELAAIVSGGAGGQRGCRERVRRGNAKAIGPMVGHVMRETEGRADGGEVTSWSTSSWGSEPLRHPQHACGAHFDGRPMARARPCVDMTNA